MNKKVNRKDLPPQKFTVEVYGREYTVDARDNQEAKKLASYLYKKEVPDDFRGLTEMQRDARIKKHIDKRYADQKSEITSVLEIEEIEEAKRDKDKFIDSIYELLDNKRTAEQLKELLKTI